MGAPLAARPLVASGALGAVHTAEARGYSTRGKHVISSDHRVPSSNVAGNSGESEAGACAIHVVTARCADDVVFRCGSVVERPFTAAACVQVLGATALRGGADWAGFANGHTRKAVLSNLARLTRKYVGRVVAGATSLARYRACFWLVFSAQALEAFNCRVAWTVRALLTQLATEAVRGVVARSTDRALAAAPKRLVRAGRAFKTPGPVAVARPIGSL
eukprot:scaffold9786_cov77-Phaeocystis_antarctica.AAC.3